MVWTREKLKRNFFFFLNKDLSLAFNQTCIMKNCFLKYTQICITHAHTHICSSYCRTTSVFVYISTIIFFSFNWFIVSDTDYLLVSFPSKQTFQVEKDDPATHTHRSHRGVQGFRCAICWWQGRYYCSLNKQNSFIGRINIKLFLYASMFSFR